MSWGSAFGGLSPGRVKSVSLGLSTPVRILPVVSIVVLFLGLPFRILNIELVQPKKSSTMETTGTAELNLEAQRDAVLSLGASGVPSSPF